MPFNSVSSTLTGTVRLLRTGGCLLTRNQCRLMELLSLLSEHSRGSWARPCHTVHLHELLPVMQKNTRRACSQHRSWAKNKNPCTLRLQNGRNKQGIGYRRKSILFAGKLQMSCHESVDRFYLTHHHISEQKNKIAEHLQAVCTDIFKTSLYFFVLPQ